MKKSFLIILIITLLASICFIAYSFLNNSDDNGVCATNSPTETLFSLNISEAIENEDINDISLTIYYLDPSAFVRAPLSIEMIKSGYESKIVKNGTDLIDYIDSFKAMDNVPLTPLDGDCLLDCRIYYTLESSVNGPLLDVAMYAQTAQENSDTGLPESGVLINGTFVKTDPVFLNAILPILNEADISPQSYMEKHSR